jgi:hypothetical protein
LLDKFRASLKAEVSFFLFPTNGQLD